MLPVYAHDSEFKSSKGIRLKDKIYGWIRLIFSDQQSRNLFLFLCINLSFAFVELSYGMWTNSLGLISDAFHMFFDCTALLCGLAASMITKWKANERFSFGYVRAEVIGGFINGLFLIFVSFFIFSEAIERLFEPPEVQHDRLMIVSVLGFIVNLIGIFVFQHGGAHHGHSHGGDSGHAHETHNDHSHEAKSNPLLQSFTEMNHHGDHGHSHGGHGHENGGSHGHSHNNHGHSHDAPANSGRSQIMQGVFLHIMADTLGSVGVIISAILMQNFGWMIADPICSIFIASLVFLSVLPLLRDSVYVLMQRTPSELESALPGCYQKVMQVEGVLSVQQPHFWTLCTESYVGSIKVEVSPSADPRNVQMHVHSIFAQIGVRNLYVQIDWTY
ncbi:Zinc transporter 7 [Halotydeus destructor]|nr:Zinc transporter 7 [Halotydeus destructor]